MKPGQVASEQELRDHLAPRYTGYRLPDGFVFVSEMPRTSTGKILKSALRERYGTWPARPE
ncbi:Long-chain-fatty-acid--CoA ligase [compost metagenome]